MPDRSLLHESVNQLHCLGDWLHRQSAGSILTRAEANSIVWCHTIWPFGNQAVLLEELRSDADVDRNAAALTSFAAGRSETFLLLVCHSLIHENLGPRLPELLSRHGMRAASTTMGMVADGLLPSHKAAPAGRIHRVRTQEQAITLSRINAAAYLVPQESADDLAAKISLVADDCFAYVLEIDGRGVSTAATFVLDKCLYVAFVATLPVYMRRGFGEAVFRASVEAAMRETGLSHVVLHATDHGYPVYRRMGFRDVVPCTMFAAHPQPVVP